jgi:hypothetical protein
MKFTNVVTKIEFGKEDIKRALADYVDLEFHRPDLAKSIRENKFKLTTSASGEFSIKVATK